MTIFNVLKIYIRLARAVPLEPPESNKKDGRLNFKYYKYVK